MRVSARHKPALQRASMQVVWLVLRVAQPTSTLLVLRPIHQSHPLLPPTPCPRSALRAHIVRPLTALPGEPGGSELAAALSALGLQVG